MASKPPLRGVKRSAISATSELDGTSHSHSKIRRLATPSASAAPSRSNTPNVVQESIPQASPSPRARFASQADEVQLIENEEETTVDNDLLAEDVQSNVHQRIAAAFHDSESSVISFLEDTEDSKTFDLVITLMGQLEPHVILIGSRSDEGMMEAIEAYCQEHDDCDYQVRPYKEFNIGLATARLSNLSVISSSRNSSNDMDVSTNRTRSTGRNSTHNDDNGTIMSNDQRTTSGMTRSDIDLNEEERAKQALLRLGCFTNLDAFLAVCAGGALLACLQRNRALGAAMDGVPVVRDVQSIHMEKYMLLTADALSSLQIFDAQDNASMHASKQKEGLSLFGILNTCLTPIGSSLLRRWLIRPLISISDIEARHQAVSVLVRVDNQATVTDIGNALKKVKNVYRLFNQLEGGSSHWGTWKNIMDFLLAAVLVRQHFADVNGAETTEIYHKLMDAVNLEVILKIAKQMSEMVDWDATRAEQRLQIADGVDEHIDEWRELQGRKFCREDICHGKLTQSISTELPEILQNLAQVIAHELPADFPFDIDCQSFPQLGYLVAIDAREDEPVEEVVPPDWTFQFRDDEAWYFRCPHTLKLDEHLGDVYNKINDRSIDLLDELLEGILAAQTQILAATDSLAEMDCLMAFATATRDYQLHRPQMVEDNVIKIQKGRHLLYELTMDMYVSNDTLLAGGQGISREDEETFSKTRSLMVLASSNGSGKTAYAKQVALITVMAQIGCFVPATAATLGPVDKIYTRLQTKESSAKAASAFMIDLGQVSQALRGATARSLLVLDEFGKGTTPEDGAGLLAGVLMHLLQRGSKCPKTIAITHFHELFVNQILPPDLPISFWQMETVYQDGSTGEGSASLGYLYRLIPSTSLSSRAFECAAAHNVGQEIVDRARFVSHHLGKFEIGPIIDAITMTEQETRELKEAEDLARRFLKWDLKEPLGKEETVRDILARMLADVCREGTEGEGETTVE